MSLLNRGSVLAAALLTLVVGEGCYRGGAPNPFEAGRDGARTIRVEAHNLNFADATLYARRGSERIRMGTVTGKTSATFEVPWTTTVPLQIEIDLLAGPSCVTRAMTVDPGEVIQVQVPINLGADPDCR